MSPAWGTADAISGIPETALPEDTEEQKRAWAIQCAVLLHSGKPTMIYETEVINMAESLLRYRKYGRR